MPFFPSVFLVLIFTSAAATGKQHVKADEVTAIVDSISSSNIYETTYAVGFTGALSEQYQRFARLAKLARIEQLIDLAGTHPNAVVRLYAYQALKKRKAIIPGSLISRFGHDNTVVRTLNGCI